MNIQLYIVAFFLLFSPLDSMEELLFSYPRGGATIQDELALKNEIQLDYEEALNKALEFGLELPADYISEKEKELNDFLINGDGPSLTEALENPEFGEQSDSSPLVNYDSKIFDDASSIAEKVYLSENYILRLVETRVENFALKEHFQDTELINVNDEVFVRFFYDEGYNLKEKSVWKNGRSLKDMKLLSRTFYDYVDSRFCESRTENFVENYVTVLNYDSKMNPVLAKKYIVDEELGKKVSADEAAVSSKEKNDELTNYVSEISTDELFLVTNIERSFDDSGRIICEESKYYDASLKDGKVVKVLKNIFKYGDKSTKADYEYFENDRLCISVVYTAENSYVEKLFFDGGYEICNEYVDGKKVLEVFYEKKKEIRRRSF